MACKIRYPTYGPPLVEVAEEVADQFIDTVLPPGWDMIDPVIDRELVPDRIIAIPTPLVNIPEGAPIFTHAPLREPTRSRSREANRSRSRSR